MNRSTDRSERISATGVTIGSILALIVALAIAVAFDIQPAEASTRTIAHDLSARA